MDRSRRAYLWDRQVPELAESAAQDASLLLRLIDLRWYPAREEISGEIRHRYEPSGTRPALRCGPKGRGSWPLLPRQVGENPLLKELVCGLLILHHILRIVSHEGIVLFHGLAADHAV